ncbi:MAG: class I SAM-dependent methyltransferase [Chlorobi bacterium]|nr:class I SAM-dependent methyltransferase [Chlorobiota bacterium]
MDDERFICNQCQTIYPIKDDIPLLLTCEESWHKTTKEIKTFYEETPYPNYDNCDKKQTLINKSKKSFFTKKLDEEIDYNAKILDIGCGTGQLVNFLSIANRLVVGIDISFNSLKLAKNFAKKNHLYGSHFIQSNLFLPIFKEKSFDYVIANGVLHHTYNPYYAFQICSKKVKRGGFLIIGLYHKYGRVVHNLIKKFYSDDELKIRNYDKILSEKIQTFQRYDAWYKDQYKNPKESTHTIREIINWFTKNNFTFIRSLPSAALFDDFDESERLFERQYQVSKLEIFLNEILMLITNNYEGGFFIGIGQKN